MQDSGYIFNETLCDFYKSIAGFDRINVDEIEKTFPIAYAILIYNHAEQFHRLLRMIWRPQNYYCIHIDSKSEESFKKAIKSIVNCFDNVFISSKSEAIYWGHFSMLNAELICMKDLIKKSHKWKYLIHMSGNQFPLRTNYEMVQILKMYNGSNDISK